MHDLDEKRTKTL
jgi:structural maintenance of chromosome 2